ERAHRPRRGAGRRIRLPVHSPPGPQVRRPRGRCHRRRRGDPCPPREEVAGATTQLAAACPARSAPRGPVLRGPPRRARLTMVRLAMVDLAVANLAGECQHFPEEWSQTDTTPEYRSQSDTSHAENYPIATTVWRRGSDHASTSRSYSHPRTAMRAAHCVPDSRPATATCT